MRRIARSFVALVALVVVAGASPSVSDMAPGSAPPDVIGEVSVVVVLLDTADGTALTPDDLAAAVAVMEARLAALPAPGTTLTPVGGDRVRIEIGDPSQGDSIRRVATAAGELLFVPVPNARFGDVVEGEPLPSSIEAIPILDGTHLERARAGTDQMGQPALQLDLDAEGAELFDAYAATHPGERLALVLDGIVVSAPTINASRFGGLIEVSGTLDEQAVAELVAILVGGPLPVLAEPLTVCPAPASCPVPSLQPVPTPSP